MNKYDSEPEPARQIQTVPLEHKKPMPVGLPQRKIIPSGDDLLTIFKKNAIPWGFGLSD